MAVDVLGDRRELLVGEPAEGVLHELEVVVEVAATLLSGQAGEELRVAVGGAERAGAVEGIGFDAPRGLTAEQPAGELADGVGDERTGDLGLGVAEHAVVEHRAGGLDRGAGMGEVVAEHLIDIRAAACLQRLRALLDDGSSQLDDVRGGGEIGSNHGRGG